MFDFIEKIRKELAVIRGALWSVAIIAAVVAAVVWFFAGQIYGSAVSAKDATIETLKTQNDSYKEKLSGATPEEAKKRIRHASLLQANELFLILISSKAVRDIFAHQISSDIY